MIMPTVTLKVTLNAGSLDVNQAGNGNQIDHGQSVKIAWHLIGPGTRGGAFNAIKDPNGPGFAWVNPPEAGIFGKPEVAGKEITLTDDNTTASSVGDWIYELRATINGKQYSTVTILPVATTQADSAGRS
ncbi:MAG: hypothetical protein ABI300_10815 [Rhodanobacter sp.]